MSITPRVIQRTPDLGIKIKLQRLPVVPDAVPAAAPPKPVEVLPPFWEGWLDDDGERMTDITESMNRHNADTRTRFFWQSVFVAVVDGASNVDWEIEFVPEAGSVAGDFGEAQSYFLNSEAREGVPRPQYEVLPTEVAGEDTGWHYAMDFPIDRKFRPLLYYPVFAAISNTLVVNLYDPRGTMPGLITATASINSVVVGVVTLTLES